MIFGGCQEPHQAFNLSILLDLNLNSNPIIDKENILFTEKHHSTNESMTELKA